MEVCVGSITGHGSEYLGTSTNVVGITDIVMPLMLHARGEINVHVYLISKYGVKHEM